jgi:hypothetical protein
MTDPDQLAGLRADAHYARERYDLYRAKVYGSRPTSMTRLRELQRASAAAEARLQHAEHRLAAPDGPDRD